MKTKNLLILTLALPFAGACGASVVERNTTAARFTAIAIDATAGGIEVFCAEPQIEANPDRLDPCLRAAEAHALLRAKWRLWSAAIMLAANDEDENAIELMIALADPVFDLYDELVDFLEAFGVQALPPIPGRDGGPDGGPDAGPDGGQ